MELEDIKRFSKKYNENEMNKVIENAITANGLEKACINKRIIEENPPVFNIELPETSRYNQKESHKCWIYAGLNVIQYEVAKKLNIPVKDLALSSSYLSFFDKLEKSNTAYENIIQLENIDFDYIHSEKMLLPCMAEGGYWPSFASLVEKYGIVPESIMPNAVEGENVIVAEGILKEKVKKDILEIIKMKKRNKDIEQIEKQKDLFLQENYELLSKIYGEPKLEFNYEYKDKEGKYICYRNITPIQFKDKFLSLKLKDFVCIANVPMYNKEYGKVYQKKYWESIKDESLVKFLNLPIEELKKLAVKQLRDGVPVQVGAHIRKFRDKTSGVLDTRIYNYESSLLFKRLTKIEALNMKDIVMHHAMAIVGVNVVEEKTERWKIEDSYGEKEKVNGYYIMNDEFFDDFVFEVVINKRYLSEAQIKMLEQKPILFEITEPY